MRQVGWDEIEEALRQRPPLRLADGGMARAAVALLLREGAAGIELLFIRRAEHPRDPWSGQMGFPGGRAEPSDVDLLGTVSRETCEEIGADLEHDALRLGQLDDLRAMARARPLDLSITPFVFRLCRSFQPVLSGEVRSVHWFALDELLDPARRSELDHAYQGRVLRFPCLRMLPELVIWGLTYRMLMGLSERLLEAGELKACGELELPRP